MLNYAIIVVGSFRVEGEVDRYRYKENGNVINITINGEMYETSVCNIIMMERNN